MSGIEIKIPQGILKGKNVVTSRGIQYRSYQGIPYAKPPIGDLRFKDPQPGDNWSGVLDATNASKICSQYDQLLLFKYVGVEDCLYLNVYVPKNATTDSALPVMFWVHGGGFTMGSGNADFYGPDHLMDRDIILVTINYRLGSLGFLCLNNDEVPGNAGFKDQVLALRWVNDNIKHFGGDSKNITLFGESAGGVSTHLLALSPLAKGLFSKIICQSGVATVPWGLQSKPEEMAFRLGGLLGSKTTDKKELLEFLRKVPVEDMIMACNKPEMADMLPSPFCIVVENSISEGTAFIDKNPVELLKAGNYTKVPMIFSCTSKEGVLLLHKIASVAGLENATVDKLIPDFLMFVPPEARKALGEEKSIAIANKIKQFYFENAESVLENYTDLMSDTVFINYIDSSVKAHSMNTPPVYYCQFSYNGTFNVMKFVAKFPYTGAAHADDLGYMFQPDFSMNNVKPVIPQATDILIVKRMTEMWTNFAKFGNPTPQLNSEITTIWEPVAPNKVNCLEINEQLRLFQNPFEKRISFWNNLFK